MDFKPISPEDLKQLRYFLPSNKLVENMQRKGLSCCIFSSGVCIVNQGQVLENPNLVQSVLNDVALLGLVVNKIYQCEPEVVQHHIQALRASIKAQKKGANDDVAAKADFMQILSCAVKYDCSDIHINVSDPETHVVFRRHGEAWRGSPLLPTYNDALHMISRAIGVEGRHQASGDFDKTSIQHTSYTEKITLDSKEQNVMLRFEKHPLVTRGDFKTVIRINKQQAVKDLKALKAETEFQTATNRIMLRGQGLIVVVGPTGSGKTTLMHGMIKAFPRDRFMDTLEDPVEIVTKYNPLISQHNYIEKTGYNHQLRSILRLDPDAILIGEMRDDETAQLAFNSARTGHLTLTSLHADGVLACFHRLKVMHVPFPIQGEGELLLMLVSTRLIPILCECKVRDNNPSSTICHRNPSPCELCFNGITHREPVIEYLILTPSIRHYLIQNRPDELYKHLTESGWLQMKDKVLKRVMRGEVAPSDAITIPGFDDLFKQTDNRDEHEY